ncbi:MAG: anti-sigma factor family protein [Acidiferrobacterales bacterium]
MLRKLRAVAMRYLPFMITCRSLEGFVIDYFEGTLPERQRLRFSLHLRLCRDCRHYLNAYQRATALSHVAFCELDEPVPEELVKAILAARQEDA